MTLRRHLYSALVALLAFGILSLLSGTWGLPTLIAAAVIALVCTALYFHYRKRAVVEDLVPVTPGRDDRVIPQDVKIMVTLRDRGQCQLKYPGICTLDHDLQFDHIWPWSKGGSSKDPDNIQLACGACNKHKSNTVPV